jgi:hypothetical protein
MRARMLRNDKRRCLKGYIHMLNSHCGQTLTTTHDTRSFIRKRCQVCKRVFQQNKRLPANTIRVREKIRMIGEHKRERICSLAEAKAAIEKILADTNIEVI